MKTNFLKAGMYLLAFGIISVAMFVIATVGAKALFSGDLIKFVGAVTILYFSFNPFFKVKGRFDFYYWLIVGK